jgi:hypothetical protein
VVGLHQVAFRTVVFALSAMKNTFSGGRPLVVCAGWKTCIRAFFLSGAA